MNDTPGFAPVVKRNLLKEGALTENSAGIGTVTRAMVRERAVELAAIDGRAAQAVSKSDWDQAKEELTGVTASDAKQDILEAAAESERWDPLPGSSGTKAPTSGSEDEDEEGRSDNERLVVEGIAGAEHDEMVKAARATEREG